MQRFENAGAKNVESSKALDLQAGECEAVRLKIENCKLKIAEGAEGLN
jgi:hypothetical protein